MVPPGGMPAATPASVVWSTMDVPGGTVILGPDWPPPVSDVCTDGVTQPVTASFRTKSSVDAVDDVDTRVVTIIWVKQPNPSAVRSKPPSIAVLIGYLPAGPPADVNGQTVLIWTGLVTRQALASGAAGSHWARVWNGTGLVGLARMYAQRNIRSACVW